MARKVYISSFAAILLVILSAFYTLPYYVTKPGMAKELEPIIEVEGGDEAAGSFMLTTVRIGKANIYGYLMAKWSKYQEIYTEEEIKPNDESDEEYNLMQLHMMDSAKNHAVKIAYEKAGEKVETQYMGIYVLNVIDGMPAAEVLKPGDQITVLDGKKFRSSQEFIEYVSKKKPGEKVTITYISGGEEKTAELALKAFKDEPGRAGLGISPEDYTQIKTERDVSIDTDQIGGPSAGFMFSLEIYNQLTEGDLTAGYQIAGTGTMEEDGSIGPIGGIHQKIVAADNAGADIFFAPNEKGAKDSNYRAAAAAAKDIGSKMKIIPVDTFDEAVAYLHSLKKAK